MPVTLYSFEEGPTSWSHQEVDGPNTTGRWIWTWEEPNYQGTGRTLVDATRPLTASEVETLKARDAASDALMDSIMDAGTLSATHEHTVSAGVAAEVMKPTHRAMASLMLEQANIPNA